MVRYIGDYQYDVMVAGSRRITTRNRAHLRKLKIDVDMTANRAALQMPPQPDPEKNGKNEEKNEDITYPTGGGGQGPVTPSTAIRRNSRVQTSIPKGLPRPGNHGDHQGSSSNTQGGDSEIQVRQLFV